jgi:hypothetical protein
VSIVPATTTNFQLVSRAGTLVGSTCHASLSRHTLTKPQFCFLDALDASCSAPRLRPIYPNADSWHWVIEQQRLLLAGGGFCAATVTGATCLNTSHSFLLLSVPYSPIAPSHLRPFPILTVFPSCVFSPPRAVYAALFRGHIFVLGRTCAVSVAKKKKHALPRLAAGAGGFVLAAPFESARKSGTHTQSRGAGALR